MTIGSLVGLFIFGLNAGIDFTGGSILEITYQNERLSNQAVTESLANLGLGSFSVQPVGEKGVIIKMKYLG